MATRFYLPSGPSGGAMLGVSPAVDSSWEAAGFAARRVMSPSKSGSAIASTALATILNSPAGAVDVGILQFITAPLEGSGTISGAIKGQLRALESAAAADLRMQAVIRVCSRDGSTYRGTLVATDTAALANEFDATNLTNRKMLRSQPVTPSAVSYVAGDRIVVELGYRKHENAVTSRTGTFSFGDPIGSTDLAQDESTTTADAPWIEFTEALSFEYAPPTFIGSAVGAGSPCVTSVPTGTLDGDLMLMFIKVAYGTRTDPSGWELLDQTSLGAIWFRIASSEPSSYSVTVPSATCRSIIQVYRGVDQSDPIMAFRAHGGATSDKKTDVLWFQSCDTMLVSFNGQTANLSPTAPSGWTQAGLQAGTSGGDVGVGGAYLVQNATEGAAKSGDWGGNTNPYVVTIALRGNGQTTLSLKGRALVSVLTDNRAMPPSQGATISSLPVGNTPGRRTGDLEVVVYTCKHTTNATPPSFNTPSGTGFAKHGSDQIYSQSVVNPFLHLGIGVASRIISDGSGCTVTTAATVAILTGHIMTFSTGSAGPDPSIAGTKGQSNDTSNNTTQDIPAMVALEDYAENNILMAAFCTDRGDATITAPTGFAEKMMGWASGTAGNQSTAWFVKDRPLNGAATPGALSATTNINQYNVAVQFDVGVVLEGSNKIGFQAMMIG